MRAGINGISFIAQLTINRRPFMDAMRRLNILCPVTSRRCNEELKESQ